MCPDASKIRQAIADGRTAIGIELGSTRIKSVLIGEDFTPLASGSHDWENSFIDNLWTYGLDEVWTGLQDSYRKMAASVQEQYGVPLQTAGAIGISAMMHGYLVFDKNHSLLTPFRTWRNNVTRPASEILTKLFNYPIPQRWCIAHLGQAILNREEHVPSIDFLTTLSGYLHWQLTGRKVLGIGEASGVFPIDLTARGFDTGMISQFDEQIRSSAFPWKLLDILPEVLVAGENAGTLTAEGAAKLDVSGQLRPGVPFCPPEGDAGTGMVATNSIAVRTGNVSAGTSVFSMIVLEKPLSRAYPEIDLLTTPAGELVAVVHSNNCTSDYDAWIGLLGEAAKALGADVTKAKLYDTLLSLALHADPDGGGLLAYGYLSCEHITGFSEGRPLFVRSPQSNFNLANFMRVHLFTSLGALRTGLDILFSQEAVQVDEIRGHGGFFKSREVGQKIMAAAIRVPVSVTETAGEGGAWGIALLAAYQVSHGPNETLEEFLRNKVFANQAGTVVEPDPADMAGFDEFMRRYKQGLPIEEAAVRSL